MAQTPNAQKLGSSPDDAIAALKPAIVASLKEQLLELRNHRTQIVANELDDESRKAMQFTVHNLRGTAAAYFFPEISEPAGSLECAINGSEPVSDDGFLLLTDTLIELCATALEEDGAA